MPWLSSSRVALILTALLWTLAEGCAQAPRPQFGSIHGTVRYAGAVPKSSLSDNAGGRREIFEVEAASNGLRDAVIYLDAPATVASDAQVDLPGDGNGEFPVIDQRYLRFVPHIVAVRSGEHVAFTNADPENHNVRAQAENPRNRFNILTAGGNDYERPFQPEPNGQPIRLSCDIHQWMSAWIYIFEHPYFDLSDVQGRFRLDTIPAGTYKMVVRQPDGGLRAEGRVHVEAGESTKVEIAFGRRNLQEKHIVDIGVQTAATEERDQAGE